MRNVKGLPQLKRRLHQAANRHALGFARGARAAGKMLLRESNKIIPVDTSNLQSTGYVAVTGKSFSTIVSVGYTADYAVEVHEETWKVHGEDYNAKYAEQIALGATYYIFRDGVAIERTYRLRKPEEQAKFLETAVRNNLEDVFDIIRGYMYIGEL